MYKLKSSMTVHYIREIAGRTPIVDVEFESALKECKALGFDCVDLDYATCSDFYVLAENIELLREGLQKIKDAGLQLNCVHLPYGAEVNPSDLCEIRREGLVKYLQQAFVVMDEFSPRGYVIHPSIEPLSMDKEIREKHKKQLVKTLKSLVSATKAMICVENMPRTLLGNTSDELLEIIDQVEGAKICVDVNHFLHETPQDAIRKFGHRIGTVHISDHDFINEMHRLPGQGKIDFMEVISALESVGYDGAFHYEVLLSASGYTLCTREEIKNNYEQLFKNYNAKK